MNAKALLPVTKTALTLKDHLNAVASKATNFKIILECAKV